MDELGDRMKRYEGAFLSRLPDNLPRVLRIDGRCFHSFTRGCEKPFDFNLMDMMDKVAIAVVKDVSNSRLAYVQSDEISVLICKKSKEAQFWFNNEVQKMVSIAAGVASSTATAYAIGGPEVIGHGLLPSFDARVFVLPEYEVPNYFIWRQSDWSRNSVQMLARIYYTQKQLHGKSLEQMHDMLQDVGVNWNDLPTKLKRGRCIVKKPRNIDGNLEWAVDENIPIFTEDRSYITKHLTIDESSAEANI